MSERKKKIIKESAKVFGALMLLSNIHFTTAIIIIALFGYGNYKLARKIYSNRKSVNLWIIFVIFNAVIFNIGGENNILPEIFKLFSNM